MKIKSLTGLKLFSIISTSLFFNNLNVALSEQKPNANVKKKRRTSMKAVGMVFVGLLVVGGILLLAGIGVYNGQIGANNNADKAAGDVQADLNRRFDLIPNLVASTQGYMKLEKQIFTEVADLRSRIGQTKVDLKDAKLDPKVLAQFMADQNQLGAALSKLVVAVEKYPDLKSNQTVTQLMDELAGTENRINVSRKRYNEAVLDLNNRVTKFPGSIVAGWSGVQKRQMFEASEAAKTTVPKVDLFL